MKNFILKNKLLLILIMSLFFVVTFSDKVNAASEKYFFIGDSRTYQLITYYPNHSILTWRYDTIGKFSGKVINASAVDYSGYAGTTWNNWFGVGGSSKSKLNALANAPEGTKVIIWLGVNDMNNTEHGTPTEKAELYVQEIKKLANTYKKLMFCQVSVTAVYEPKAKSYGHLLNNTRIDEFNNALKSKIASAKLSNYAYIDINSDLKSYITSNNPTVGDGLHYTNVFYRTISDLIYKKVNQASRKKMYGDANYDEKIDSNDINILKNLIKNGSVKKTIENSEYAQLDVDNDGMLTNADLEVIQLKVNGKIKVFPVKSAKNDLNLDGKELTADDIKILYEWCFASSNNGLQNSKRKVTISGTKLSSELTWKIINKYVSDYKKAKNIENCTYADLYNYYINVMQTNGKSTGKYEKVDEENYRLRKNSKVKIFLMEAEKEDFNLDGKSLTTDDIKVLYEWCFDSSNSGKNNSERQVTLGGTKLSSELTWKIMKRYVSDYKKAKNIENCTYADLYNYYINIMKSKGKSTGSYVEISADCYKLKSNKKIKVFPMEAEKEDFNLDGKSLTVDDIKVLYEWCFDSSNSGKHNSERQITIGGSKISSELTWEIMSKYVAAYKKEKNVSNCAYKDLYNYYIDLMKSKGKSTGSYTKK